MNINFYINSKKLIAFLKSIPPAGGFTHEFYYYSGGKIKTDGTNIIITNEFPEEINANAKYILCIQDANRLTHSQLEKLYDVWILPMTKARIEFYFRNLTRGIRRDRTSLHEHEEFQKRIIEMAHQDQLTGLATRWYLQDYVKTNENEENLTCIYFDLDNFKTVNDTYGHQAGDRALAATAEMMQNEFTDGFCARMGGDEFMIVLAGEREISDVERKVNDFMKNLLNYYATTRTMKKLSVSAGISQRQSAHAKTIDRLIHESDLALYEAKKAGRSCCRVYDSSMENRQEQDEEVHDAITNYYLVDYENVKNHGFNGLENMSVHDEICIFYSDNALGSFTVELHNQMNESKARIITRKAVVGTKNALDFQLAAYLGELISQNKENNGRNCNYFIVSNDKGYESLISFGKERHVNVKLIASLAGSSAPSDDMKQKLAEVLNTCTESEINEIAKIIINTSSKQEINGEIGKFIRNSQRAGEIYRSVRPLLTDKKAHS